MRVLLTNDDGIEAQGLQALRRALLELDDVELAVVAPDGNRSAMARSITTRRPLTVREVAFDDGTVGYATDGTPVDCVRLTQLGLIDGFAIELVVSGINHGANLGDDVTYSGTVAAALEAIMLDLPGIAVSQQSPPGPCDVRTGDGFDFSATAAFAAQVVDRLEDVALAPGTLLNINAPSSPPEGVTVARLGKRVYSDALRLVEDNGDGRRYEIYGEAAALQGESDTDLAAVAAGRIAVTPLHFDLTDVAGMDALSRSDLSTLLAPAAREVRRR
ncbi:MAG: 5'/3'-nucleotidase SurE [Solirubrobacteraceae bacterium]